MEYRGYVCKDGVCTLFFLQNTKSHKTHPTDQVRTSPRSENAQWGLSDRVWGSLCPHTTSAALGSWLATPSSLLEGPGTALTTWTTQILLQTIPEVWASEQQLRGLNPWASYKNAHARTTFSWQAVNIHNSIWSAKELKRQSYFQSYKILLLFFFSSKSFLPFFFWRCVSHGYMFIGKIYKSIYRLSWAKYPTHLQWDNHYQYLHPSWIFRF